MRLSHETRVTYLVMVVCALIRFAGGVVCNLWPRDVMGTLLDLWNITGYACYALFIVAWLRLLRHRSIDRETTACFTWAAAFLLLLALLSAVKHELSWWEGFSLYLWYAYYIPTAFTPALLFLGVLHIGRRSDEPIDRRWYALLAVSLTIALLVLTNNRHMLVFRFPGGPGSDPSGWKESETVRGPLALVPWIWLFLLSAVAIAVALVRCLRSGRSRRWWVLLLPLLMGLAYLAAYYRMSRVLSGAIQYRDATIVLIVVFMECLVRLGLFPANEGYGELWEASSLRGALMADDGTVAYAAAGAPQVTPGQVRKALRHPQRLQDDDELLVAHEATGGAAFWVRDLARMHQLKAQLDEQGDVLAEERAMLAAANDLAHKREAVAQHSLLYGELSSRMAPQLAHLEELLGRLPADEEGFMCAMRAAAVEATYVKRSANLMLAGEGGAVGARDLVLAMGELREAFARAGVDLVVTWEGEGELAVDDALALFDGFYADGERALAARAAQGCPAQGGGVG